MEARELFYAAEEEFLQLEKVADSVAKYKRLKNDYADTKLVEGELEKIEKRMETGKEYYLSTDDLSGSGDFKHEERDPLRQVLIRSIEEKEKIRKKEVF